MGIMNIQIHLQIKRLQLCPCPLCIFHKYWEGNSPGRSVHQHSKFWRRNPLNLQQIFTTWTLCVFTGERWFWEPPIRQQQLFLWSQERTKEKGLFSYFFQHRFWNGKYKHEKKTNFANELFPQNCEGRMPPWARLGAAATLSQVCC